MADIGVFSRYKGFADFQQEAQKASLANALVQAKLSGGAGGGSLPAPLQLANEFQKARAAGDVQRMDDIAQFAKIYDKGILPPADVPAAPAPIVPQSAPAPKLPPLSSPQAADAVLDLYGTGNDTGANGAPAPAMRPTLANAPAARTIKGYAGAAASISAAKKGAEKQAEKDVELDMNPLIKSAEVGAEGKTKKVLANDVALGDIQGMRGSIQDARQLVDKVSLTGPILGRVGAISEDPDYRNLQGALNSITLQAKELYNLGAGQGFTDADRNFLQEIVSGKYARAEAIPMALDRLDKALARREQFLQTQNANYSSPSGRPATPAAARDQFNASKAPKARLKYNPATGDFE